jgi:hypothetical protein
VGGGAGRHVPICCKLLVATLFGNNKFKKKIITPALFPILSYLMASYDYFCNLMLFFHFEEECGLMKNRT